MPRLVKYLMGKLSRLSKIRESFPPRLFCRIRYTVWLEIFDCHDNTIVMATLLPSQSNA